MMLVVVYLLVEPGWMGGRDERRALMDGWMDGLGRGRNFEITRSS